MAESSVLLVTETPAASAALVTYVDKRGRDGSANFTLLVPAVAHGLHRLVDPEDACCAEAEQTIEILRPGIEAAAGEPIATRIGSHEPLAAVEDALHAQDFDEIILAMRSGRLARRAHLDLASKLKALGPPVTVVGV